MKIYILKVSDSLRPKRQKIVYPKHNSKYGIEVDFYRYISKKRDLVVSDYRVADWHYLPVFWNRYYVNNCYGKSGQKRLRSEVGKKIIDATKTFTICQNPKALPFNLPQIILFIASRRNKKGINIPLLCDAHRVPIRYQVSFLRPTKKYLASFVGKISTHGLRKKMADKLRGRKDVFLYNGNKGPRYFAKKILDSYIVLCPRGVGYSSYRFYETMQLGSVPFLLAKCDTRPFKKFIKWKKISFYAKDVDGLIKKLEVLEKNKSKLLSMGERAKEVYLEKLFYQKWCRYVIKELSKHGKHKI